MPRLSLCNGHCEEEVLGGQGGQRDQEEVTGTSAQPGCASPRVTSACQASGRGHTVGCHDYLTELQPGYLWAEIIARIQATKVFKCSLGIFQEMSENSD